MQFTRISLLGISYIVIKGEKLQTRRPRQFLGTGHMVFSQPLTRKTLRNFYLYIFFHFVSRVMPFYTKINSLSLSLKPSSLTALIKLSLHTANKRMFGSSTHATVRVQKVNMNRRLPQMWPLQGRSQNGGGKEGNCSPL